MIAPSEICLFYATHDGHTRKIVDALTCRLESSGEEVAVYDLGQGEPQVNSFSQAQTIIVIAPIRFGYHLASVDRFVRKHKKILNDGRMALVSVNLTARKAEKNTAETNPYMRKWIKRRGLKPAIAAVFGGRLEYRLYPAWERYAIRLIMWMTGGPTNFDAAIDYTDWAKVDALAAQIAANNKRKERAA